MSEPHTIPRLAKHLGKDPRSVWQAIKAGRLVSSIVEVDGRTMVRDLDEAKAEWDANTVERVDDAMSRVDAAEPDESPSGATDYKASRARRERASAELREIELKAKQGATVSRKEMLEEWRASVTVCRQHLLALPTQAKELLPHLTTADIGVLETLVSRSLDELAAKEEAVR